MRVDHRVFVIAVIWAIGHLHPACGDDSSLKSSDIESLIDELQNVSAEGYGYTATRSGGGFLPLGVSQFGSGLLGVAPVQSSDTLRDLVARGAEAIPHLIDHLNDDRTTSITVEGGGLVNLQFPDEYQINRRTTSIPEQTGEPRNRTNDPDQHTVTVGDLCFVALGQIVNRPFSAVRYQPTMNIMVNSPTHSEWLRETIRSEWEGLTPEAHRASLLRDFLFPDNEYRRSSAALRIGYYYPELLEPLVLHQLSQPRYDVFAVSNLIRDRIYPAADAAARRELFDSAVQTHGDVVRDAIHVYLFEDLDTQEADERGALSPPLNGQYKARECLIELFNHPDDVQSSDAPYLLPTDDSEQARFIDEIWFFPSDAIDRAVLDVLNSTRDDYLAEACFDYLIGRNRDAELQDYVSRNPGLKSLGRRIGWTRLHWAAEDYDASLEHLARAIEQTPGINSLDAQGFAALHLAALRNRPHCVDLLVRRGADPNVRTPQGSTPIDLAHGEADVLLILVKAGAVPTTIHAAAMCADTSFLLKFLEEEPASIRSKDGGYESTPLHFAAHANQIAPAEVLLAHGADVNSPDSIGFTPLHVAVTHASNEMVDFLLAHGADPDRMDSQRRAPLYYANGRGNQAKIDALHRATVIEASDIHSAAIAGSSDLVLRFLEEDASLVNLPLEWQGLTPLHLAVQENHLETVRVLIDHSADVNVADDLGRTALHFAAKKCEGDMVGLLLDSGADAALLNSAGESPLDVARAAENQAAIEILAR